MGSSSARFRKNSSVLTPWAAAVASAPESRLSPVTGPRKTPLTRVRGPSSRAAVRTRLARAALDAEYAPMVGGFRRAAPEFTSTTVDRSDITGTAACNRCIAPKKLTSKMCFQDSGSASSTRAQSPAWCPFCTRWSRRPKCATVSADHPATVVGDTQVGRNDQWFTSAGPHIGGHRLESIGPPGRQHDVDATLGEADGDGPAHARTGAGDDRDLTLFEHPPLPPLRQERIVYKIQRVGSSGQ